jgi:hypothetical protein
MELIPGKGRSRFFPEANRLQQLKDERRLWLLRVLAPKNALARGVMGVSLPQI